MSGGPVCRCPLWYTSWRVVQRNRNHSAFNGYRGTWSRYSEVICLACGARWRTMAKYVQDLQDVTTEELERL